MKATQTIIGTVHVEGREPSSANGNPRFRVYLKPADPEQPGVFGLTLPDSGTAYGIENPEMREEPRAWDVGTYYGRTHIELARGK